MALEATTNTWPVVDLLQAARPADRRRHPLKTKAIAEAKIKTDNREYRERF